MIISNDRPRIMDVDGQFTPCRIKVKVDRINGGKFSNRAGQHTLVSWNVA